MKTLYFIILLTALFSSKLLADCECTIDGVPVKIIGWARAPWVKDEIGNFFAAPKAVEVSFGADSVTGLYTEHSDDHHDRSGLGYRDYGPQITHMQPGNQYIITAVNKLAAGLSYWWAYKDTEWDIHYTPHVEITVSVPACYELLIDSAAGGGAPSETNGYTDYKFIGEPTLSYRLEIRPAGATGSGLAGSGNSAGDGICQLGSMHAEFFMGNSRHGDAGAIMLLRGSIDEATVSPRGLVYFDRPDVEVIRTGGDGNAIGTLRQVRSADALVDIVPLDDPAQGYEIRYYHPVRGQTRNSDGLYTPLGLKFASWEIRKRDLGPLKEGLRITEARYGSATIHDFTHDFATNAWSLETSGGTTGNVPIRKDEKSIVSEGTDMNVVTETTKDAAGVVVAQTIRRFQHVILNAYPDNRFRGRLWG